MLKKNFRNYQTLNVQSNYKIIIKSLFFHWFQLSARDVTNIPTCVTLRTAYPEKAPSVSERESPGVTLSKSEIFTATRMKSHSDWVEYNSAVLNEGSLYLKWVPTLAMSDPCVWRHSLRNETTLLCRIKFVVLTLFCVTSPSVQNLNDTENPIRELSTMSWILEHIG